MYDNLQQEAVAETAISVETKHSFWIILLQRLHLEEQYFLIYLKNIVMKIY